MSLGILKVQNVRCIEQAELSLARGLTLISGDNGSGKTSLLEAIFILGRGRSFRARNNEGLIQHGKDHIRVYGHVELDARGGHGLGLEVTKAGTAARIDGRPASTLAELSSSSPCR